jgi:hypothetical protein
MTAERQIAANRRNALSSTGPRTAHGKAVSSPNNTRHGLYSDPATTHREPTPSEPERRRTIDGRVLYERRRGDILPACDAIPR